MEHQPHLTSPTWARHLHSLETEALHALAAVQQTDNHVRAYTDARRRAVVIARSKGATLAQIAQALCITRQAVHQTYGRHFLVDDLVDELVPEQRTSSST